MTKANKLNLALGIIAIFILVISFTAFAFTQVPKGDASMIIIGETEFMWDEIFEDYDVVSFIANENEYEGVLLSSLIIDSGIVDHESAEYAVTGIDGYQKNVGWESIDGGYLILDEHRTVFPELTESYWVTDVVTIEVVIE